MRTENLSLQFVTFEFEAVFMLQYTEKTRVCSRQGFISPSLKSYFENN